MKVFELANGVVREGARLVKYSPAADVAFPAILVGEEGRGRKLGILPVGGQIAEVEGKCPDLRYAMVGTTRHGTPKLFLDGAEKEDDEKCIVVFRTGIGFRGGNNHTGDRDPKPCSLRGEMTCPDGEGKCFECGLALDGMTFGEVLSEKKHPDEGEVLKFKDFPGQILTRGVVAQGAAGRMGDGLQMVVVIPANIVFRTAYAGRLYGAPPAHYGRFDGRKLEVMTWDDRQAADRW